MGADSSLAVLRAQESWAQEYTRLEEAVSSFDDLLSCLFYVMLSPYVIL